ncbi:DNA repair protein RecN [Fundidesulfovibrio magnetotacticus]|uniref:DNA repair protein RecN n=1 Tax=Fundidesulfovibrio magnetotacticus TaxID=2730080 RepID=A0A6V8LRT4_9BACT|nr:AAA family ATPase [Fundidesulfovibrio magnetotacticus]GFK92829.1 DNA repair protein RecN [Fundidesulfovibrio magnetotacticus]
MIEFLRIRNLALIADVELEFAPGLNVLTGETGAGKTFVLKALEFLTGERLAPDMVRPGTDKALVEALFVLEGREVILRRELSAGSGRARLSIDGQLATAEALRELKPRLLLHASQNGQQKLLSPAFQARLLDHFLPEQALLEERRELSRRLTGVEREARELRERVAHLEDRREVLELKRTEIDKAAPREGEEEELLERQQALRHARKAREAREAALDLLLGEQGAGAVLGRLERELGHLAQAGEPYQADLDAVREARLGLSELAQRLRQGGAGPADDPEAVEARLWELAQLKRKLKLSMPEILSLHREIEANLSFLDNAGLDLKRLEREAGELRAALGRALSRLDGARGEAAGALCARVEEELRGLGFSEHVRTLFEFAPVELFPADAGHEALTELSARLLFAPNPGQPPRPLDRIASGGELSRFLLALTSLRAENDEAVLIFDEVDAGIGGLTLNRVGERLKALAGERQMLLITHWPQLAALAERHFLVAKHVAEGQTETTVTRLEGRNLSEELSRMAGGGEQGRAMAEKLLLPLG